MPMKWTARVGFWSNRKHNLCSRRVVCPMQCHVTASGTHWVSEIEKAFLCARPPIWLSAKRLRNQINCRHSTNISVLRALSRLSAVVCCLWFANWYCCVLLSPFLSALSECVRFHFNFYYFYRDSSEKQTIKIFHFVLLQPFVRSFVRAVDCMRSVDSVDVRCGVKCAHRHSTHTTSARYTNILLSLILSSLN